MSQIKQELKTKDIRLKHHRNKLIYLRLRRINAILNIKI